MNKERINKKLSELCLLFGPSGCEKAVADYAFIACEGL